MAAAALLDGLPVPATLEEKRAREQMRRALALHLGVFQGIIIFLREAL